MLAQFYYHPVPKGLDETGVQMYSDEVFIRITRDVTHTVNRRAKEEDYERFPAQFRFFEKSTAAYEPIEGKLPLEFWPLATPADVLNLKGHGFRTVQDLAKGSAKTMPTHFAELLQHAKNYLKVAGEAAKATEQITQLLDENTQLREELALAKSEIAILQRDKEKAA